MKNNNHIFNNKGLTLVELMIVLVLSLLLMAAVYLTFQLQHASGQSQIQVAATQQDLRAAMDILSVDIMNAGCDPVPILTIQGIASTSTGSILSLLMDLNGNGTTTDAGENVTYQRNLNNDLERIDLNAGVTRVLASNISQLTFTYYDAQSTPVDPASQAQLVRYIRVGITKNSDQIDPQTHQVVTRHLQKTICRRNG
jgi:type IV pilus assembly protein PilW